VTCFAISDHFGSCVECSSLELWPLISIIRWQSSGKFLLQCQTYIVGLSYVQLSARCCPVFAFDWLGCKKNGSADHPVVWPRYGGTHDMCEPAVLEVTLPDKHVVDKVPVLGARVHPAGFELVGLLENCVGDDHAALHTRDPITWNHWHSRCLYYASQWLCATDGNPTQPGHWSCLARIACFECQCI